MTPREQIECELCPGCDEAKTECSGTYAACMTRPDFDAVHGKLAAFHIPLRVDPTLKPGEFRIESGSQVVLGASRLDPDAFEDLARREHDKACSKIGGVFPIDSDDRADEARKRAARRNLSETLETMLDEFYPRDKNGKRLLPPALSFPSLGTLTKEPKSAQREWVTPVTYDSPVTATGPLVYQQTVAGWSRKHVNTFAPAVGSESTALLPPQTWQGATRSARPDGFYQGRIDEIKSMITTPVAKGKR